MIRPPFFNPADDGLNNRELSALYTHKVRCKPMRALIVTLALYYKVQYGGQNRHILCLCFMFLFMSFQTFARFIIILSCNV